MTSSIIVSLYLPRVIYSTRRTVLTYSVQRFKIPIFYFKPNIFTFMGTWYLEEAKIYKYAVIVQRTLKNCDYLVRYIGRVEKTCEVSFLFWISENDSRRWKYKFYDDGLVISDCISGVRLEVPREQTLTEFCTLREIADVIHYMNKLPYRRVATVHKRVWCQKV